MAYTSLVMTILGADRPGIVDRLSAVIDRHGGNWEESRMARLAGQFAGILKVALPHDQVDSLMSELADLADDGIDVTVHKGAPDAPTRDALDIRLQVTGHDRPGIINRITELIHAAGLNINELASECTSAPFSAGRLFTAHASLSGPATGSMDQLRDAIEQLAAEMMVDISIE